MFSPFLLQRILALVCLCVLVLPLAPAHASGTIRYVVPEAPAQGTCVSWATACSLSHALSIAVSGDQIWVKKGVHKPPVLFGGDSRQSSFVLKNGVALYGGFAGTETALNQRDWTVNITVLSGDIDNNDRTDANGVITTTANIVGNNVYHVLRSTNVNSTAVLDGFIVTGGQANGTNPRNSGGGMQNVTNGSPTLTNVIFIGNTAKDDGGGMGNYFNSNPILTNVTFSSNTANNGGGMGNYSNSSPTLTNVTFSGNTANNGGGMLNQDGSSPTLTNVTFSGNTATESGGGMVNYIDSRPTLTNVTFSGNTANLYGGGMLNQDGSSPTLTNVTFSGNTAVNKNGGGMGNYFNSSPTLTNVTFSGNTAPTGGGMRNLNSNPTLRNVIIWGNMAPNNPGMFNEGSTPTITHSNVQGCGGSSAWQTACGTNGGGNIDANPLFVDPGAGNLRLQAGSPAINRGNNAFVPSGVTTDLAGQPRIVGGTVDMGAYEYQGAAYVVSLPLVVR